MSRQVPPPLLPVGRYLGLLPAGGTGLRHAVRAGGRRVELSNDDMLVWALAHGTTGGRPAVREAAAARGAADPEPTIDRLLAGGLLTEVVSADEFARTVRLLPLAIGLGNTVARPRVFTVGHVGSPLADLPSDVFYLWSCAAIEPDLAAACRAVAGAAGAGRLLADVLAALPALLTGNAACLDTAAGAAAGHRAGMAGGGRAAGGGTDGGGAGGGGAGCAVMPVGHRLGPVHGGASGLRVRVGRTPLVLSSAAEVAVWLAAHGDPDADGPWTRDRVLATAARAVTGEAATDALHIMLDNGLLVEATTGVADRYRLLPLSIGTGARPDEDGLAVGDRDRAVTVTDALFRVWECAAEQPTLRAAVAAAGQPAAILDGVHRLVSVHAAYVDVADAGPRAEVSGPGSSSGGRSR